jgi:hypothetical protein
MPIESDAQGDLELAPDDAESVAGGKTTKAPKTQPQVPGQIPGSKPDEPERSLEGVESHA